MNSGIFERGTRLGRNDVQIEEATIRCHIERAITRLTDECEAIVSAVRSLQQDKCKLRETTPPETIKQTAAAIRGVLRTLASAVNDASGSVDQLAVCAELEFALELESKLNPWHGSAAEILMADTETA